MVPIQRQQKLLKGVNSDPKFFRICQILQELKNRGVDNKTIETRLQEASLPFKYHMFLMGNFSDIMALDLGVRQ